MTEAERYQAYLDALRRPFQKLCRLRFLRRDTGTTLFALDNNVRGDHRGAFLSDGSITANMQNGQRRTASVTISNVGGDFYYEFGKVWFDTVVALDEGLILPDGTDYYIQQGVFLIDTPQETLSPNNRTVTWNLVDKWANLDGTLSGNLEAVYEVPSGTNLFQPIQSILLTDLGGGKTVDTTTPVFTNYYNGMTQDLPSGGSASMTDTPYTIRIEGDGGTYADLFLELAGTVNAWIGYDRTGALRIDPSQDDISDAEKPIQWHFSTGEAQLSSAEYQVKNQEVYNDYIVVGEQLDDNTQPAGRAMNLDPSSDTNVTTIGRKTFRESAAGYATATQCRDLAVWRLKRAAGLRKAVTVTCSQMMHIEENGLITIARPDKEGAPVERHLITGFSRPLTGTQPMTIECVSVNDYPNVTATTWPE